MKLDEVSKEDGRVERKLSMTIDYEGTLHSITIDPHAVARGLELLLRLLASSPTRNLPTGMDKD